MKKENKTNKGKKKAGNGDKNGDGTKSTLEKMLESSAKQSDGTGSAAVSGDAEVDDMLSVVKRRRQLAAQAAEEKKKREAQEKIM